MRHTLLPIAERNVLHSEYRVRAGIVLCFMISVAAIIGILALFPAFFRASIEERSGLSRVSSLKEVRDQNGITQIEKQLWVDNGLLIKISESSDSFLLSKAVEEVAAVRGPIQFSSIALTRMATSSVGMAIQGNSPTREALLAFKTRLENLSPGNAVNLPISELAKSSNINFALEFAYLIP